MRLLLAVLTTAALAILSATVTTSHFAGTQQAQACIFCASAIDDIPDDGPWEFDPDDEPGIPPLNPCEVYGIGCDGSTIDPNGIPGSPMPGPGNPWPDGWPWPGIIRYDTDDGSSEAPPMNCWGDDGDVICV